MTAALKPKKEKYWRRQQDVFDAAAKVFAEKGYHGASTGDIAAELGIAQSSLYYYFSSKDEALERVCLNGIEGYVERLTAIARESRPVDEKIKRAILAHIQPVIDIPDCVKSYHGERRYLPPDSRRKLGRMLADYNDLFEEILEAGVAQGVLRNDLSCSASTLLILAQCNAAQFWVSQPGGPDLKGMAQTIADGFLKGAINR